MDLIATLAGELNLRPEAVDAAVRLIDEGNTIPFIARYRKEATGGMDDVAQVASGPGLPGHAGRRAGGQSGHRRLPSRF